MFDKKETRSSSYISWRFELASDQLLESVVLEMGSKASSLSIKLFVEDFERFIPIFTSDTLTIDTIEVPGFYNLKQQPTIGFLKHRVLMALLPSLEDDMKKLSMDVRSQGNLSSHQAGKGNYTTLLLSNLDTAPILQQFYLLDRAFVEAKKLLRTESSLFMPEEKEFCRALITHYSKWSKRISGYQNNKEGFASLPIKKKWTHYHQYAAFLGFWSEPEFSAALTQQEGGFLEPKKPKRLPDMPYIDIIDRVKRFLYGDLLGLTTENKKTCIDGLLCKLQACLYSTAELNYKDSEITCGLYWIQSDPQVLTEIERVLKFGDQRFTYIWYKDRIYLNDLANTCALISDQETTKAVDDVFPESSLDTWTPATPQALATIDAAFPDTRDYPKLTLKVCLKRVIDMLTQLQTEISQNNDSLVVNLNAKQASQYYWALPGDLAQWAVTGFLNQQLFSSGYESWVRFCERMPNPELLLRTLLYHEAAGSTTFVRAALCLTVIQLFSSVYPYVIGRNSKYLKTPVAMSCLIENVMQVNLQGAAHGPKLGVQQESLRKLTAILQEVRGQKQAQEDPEFDQCLARWQEYISIHLLLGERAQAEIYSGSIGQRGPSHGIYLKSSGSNDTITPADVELWVGRRLKVMPDNSLILTPSQEESIQYCTFLNPQDDSEGYNQSIQKAKESMDAMAATLSISSEKWLPIAKPTYDKMDRYQAKLQQKPPATSSSFGASDPMFTLRDLTDTVFGMMFRKLVPPHLLEPQNVALSAIALGETPKRQSSGDSDASYAGSFWHVANKAVFGEASIKHSDDRPTDPHSLP